MTIALILFGLAAVGGLVLARQRLSGKPQPSLPLALVHGAAAASGLVALIAFVAGGGAQDSVKLGLVLMVTAAIGGLFLLSRHLRGVALPIPVMIAHGLIAGAGFITLLVSALR
jgi:hypothetical protein